MSAINSNIAAWSSVKSDSRKDVLSPSSQQILLLTVEYPSVTGTNGQILKAINPFGEDNTSQDHILLQSVNNIIPLRKQKNAINNDVKFNDKCNDYTPLLVLKADDRQTSNDPSSDLGTDSNDYVLPHHLTESPSEDILPDGQTSNIEQALSDKFELDGSYQNSPMISFETSGLPDFSCSDKGVLDPEEIGLNSDDLEIGQELRKLQAEKRNKDIEVKLPNELCSVGWNTESESDSEEVSHIISDKPVLPRAKQTLPASYLTFHNISNRKGAIGVFAKKEIPGKAQFGPLDGIQESYSQEPPCPGIKLLLEKPNGSCVKLSVQNEESSNWMRYVRVADNPEEQNVSLSQIGNSLFFTTIKSLSPGQELRVWYSTKYAALRNLPLLSDGGDRWRCPKCPFKSTTNRAMNKHLATHRPSHKFSIPAKYKKFNSQSRNRKLKIKKSVNEGKNMKMFWCSHCELSFETTTLLNFHMLAHAADNIESSPKVLQSLEEEAEHVNEVVQPLYCELCGKACTSTTTLALHFKSHSGDKSYECPLCRKTFDKLLLMKSHIHTHRKNGVYRCSQCDKEFREYKHVRKHIRMLHSERMFECNLCYKCFPSSDKLKNHMLSHSNHKQYLCAYCGKQFKRKDKLSDHMRRIHNKDKKCKKHPSYNQNCLKNPIVDYLEMGFKCHECEVGFKRRGMLVNHLLSRHPEIRLDSVPELNQPILKTTKDYYCQYCDKIYKSSSKRKNHILKFHPGAKLPLSNRASGQKGENASFTQTVGSVPADPQSCQFCSKQYASKAKLLQHQRKTHLHLMPNSLRVPGAAPLHPTKTQRLKKPAPGSNTGEASSKTNNTKSLIQETFISQSADFEVFEGNGHFLSDGGIIVDGPTLKRALKGEMSTMECLLDTGLEQLLAESRPDQYFKVIQTQGGITLAQPVEIWDPLSLSPPANDPSSVPPINSPPPLDSDQFLPR